MWLLVFQRLTLDFVLHLIYFPLWWYTAGALRAGRELLKLFNLGNEYLAPGIWLRNLFVPMFGQYDWRGRIMSFFMRLANILVRSLLLGIWGAVGLTLFAIWLVAPVIVLFFFATAFYQLLFPKPPTL